MADRKTIQPIEGESRLGASDTNQTNAQGVLYLGSNAGADKPSLLALDAVSDAGVVTTYYLWVDSTGDLRIGSAVPTNQDSDGSVVGGQS